MTWRRGRDHAVTLLIVEWAHCDRQGKLLKMIHQAFLYMAQFVLIQPTPHVPSVHYSNFRKCMNYINERMLIVGQVVLKEFLYLRTYKEFDGETVKEKKNTLKICKTNGSCQPKQNYFYRIQESLNLRSCMKTSIKIVVT